MADYRCALYEEPHEGGIEKQITVIPETLHLCPGSEEIDFADISSLVSIYFCDKHWEEIKNRVLQESVNVLDQLEIDANSYYPTISYKKADSRRAESVAELETERQRIIRDSLERNHREKSYRRNLAGKDEQLDDLLFETSDVQRKFTQWTLKELPAEKLGKTEPLKQELVEQLNGRGYSAERIYQPEADVAALKNGNEFYFQVKWLNESSEEVVPADRVAAPEDDRGVWKHSAPSDLYYGPNRVRWNSRGLRHFAGDRDGIPVTALRWDGDGQWYIQYYQPSNYGSYITRDEHGWIPFRIHQDYTPLPGLDIVSELPDLNEALDEFIQEQLREYYSDLSFLHRFKYWIQRWRSNQI